MQLNHLKVICMVSTAWLLIWFIPNSPRLVLGLINLFITFPILLMTSIYIIFSHARAKPIFHQVQLLYVVRFCEDFPTRAATSQNRKIAPRPASENLHKCGHCGRILILHRNISKAVVHCEGAIPRKQ